MSQRGLPQIKLEEVGSHRIQDYVVRFCFGAGIALVAGLVGMKFGPTLGGIFLGFPAILPASLTMIQKSEGKEQAAIDSEGAILGSIALIAFALIVWIFVVKWGVVMTLGASLASWLVIAVVLYVAVRAIMHREPVPP